MSDDVTDRDPKTPPARAVQRGDRIPVSADPHRFPRRLIHGRHDGSGRAAIQVEQMLLEFDGDPVFARHDPDPLQGGGSQLGHSAEGVEFGGVELARRGPQQDQRPDDAAGVVPQRVGDACPHAGDGVLRGVLVARGEFHRVGDDHRLTGAHDVGSDQWGIERDHVVAVAQFRGQVAGVFEPGVLLPVEDSDPDGGRIARTERGIQQGVHDSGDRVGGLQRGVQLHQIGGQV